MNILLRKGDFWSGLILAFLGAYIVYESSRWEYMTEEGPGPGFFPIWYGGVMLITSLLLMLGTIIKQRHIRSEPLDWSSLRRVGFCWTALVATIFSTEYLGFYISFALLIWLLATVLFQQTKRKATLISVGGAVIFFLLFSVGLDIDLPSGELIVNYF